MHNPKPYNSGLPSMLVGWSRVGAATDTFGYPKPLRIWYLSQNEGSLYIPQSTIILIMGTSKMVQISKSLLIHGNGARNLRVSAIPSPQTLSLHRNADRRREEAAQKHHNFQKVALRLAETHGVICNKESPLEAHLRALRVDQPAPSGRKPQTK